MKDYKNMYLDLVEEISCSYEDFIYKNMVSIKNDDVEACKLQNYCINVLFHLLTYCNVLSLKYDSDIFNRFNEVKTNED